MTLHDCRAANSRKANGDYDLALPASACAKSDRPRGSLFLSVAATIILAAAASWTAIESLLLQAGWVG
jgi:hypothetical protein